MENRVGLVPNDLRLAKRNEFEFTQNNIRAILRWYVNLEIAYTDGSELTESLINIDYQGNRLSSVYFKLGCAKELFDEKKRKSQLRRRRSTVISHQVFPYKDRVELVIPENQEAVQVFQDHRWFNTQLGFLEENNPFTSDKVRIEIRRQEGKIVVRRVDVESGEVWDLAVPEQIDEAALRARMDGKQDAEAFSVEFRISNLDSAKTNVLPPEE